MIERELTYLAKFLPAELAGCESKEVVDLYLPQQAEHPILRLRKNGEKYEMTKKEPVEGRDSSKQEEQTISLSEEEYVALGAVPAKRVAKRRFLYPCQGRTAEVDVFLDGLAGLVLVDFEFATDAEKAAFTMPDFCLADVTQEQFAAGGRICGKSYADLEGELKRFSYQPLKLT